MHISNKDHRLVGISRIRSWVRYTWGLIASLAIATVVAINVASPLANSLQPHTAGVGHNTLTCQVGCQPVALKEEEESDLENFKKCNKKEAPLLFGDAPASVSMVGLLKANIIWKQSSWVPPDLLLQSGAYSSSL